MLIFPIPRLVCFNTQPHPLIRLQNIDDLEENIRPEVTLGALFLSMLAFLIGVISSYKFTTFAS